MCVFRFFSGAEQLYCGEFDSFELMTDEQMLACFQDADVCVMGADYDEVSIWILSYVRSRRSCSLKSGRGA